MKRLLCLGAMVAVLATSCSSRNATSGSANNDSYGTTTGKYYQLKGEWEIESVAVDKGYKIKPFDENADSQCFVGSRWTLVPNNNTGSYALLGGANCPTVTQAIKFDVTPDNQFKFKKIMAGEKAKSVKSGYYLLLQNLTPNSFTLAQSLDSDGQVVKAYYNFKRIK